MHKKRRAAWESLIAKKARRAKRIEEIERLEPKARSEAFARLHHEMAKGPMEDEITFKEQSKLMHVGMFEGLNRADALEEARYVVRYWLHGMLLDPIRWRWESEVEIWFWLGETWGAERQAEKLRNMIEASKNDPDYWDALNWLVVLLRARGEPMPEDLVDWTIDLHKTQIRELRQQHEGYLKEPKRPRSNEGQPRYAMDNRNKALAYVFGLLGHLGLESESVRRRVIAEHQEISVRSVSDAIEAGVQQDGELPMPWECWPLRN